MKKFLMLFVMGFFLTNATVARAQFPVFDFAGSGDTVTNIKNTVGKTLKTINKWKEQIEGIKILSDIKAAYEKIKALVEKIKALISLFERALDLLDESIKVARKTVNLIEKAKKLVLRPLEIARAAVKLSENAVEFLNSADEYAARYKKTLEEANEARRSPHKSVFEKAEALDAEAMELNRTAKSQMREAQSLSKQAARLVNEVPRLYKDMMRINREIVYTQEQACMLKVKAMQLKTDFRNMFCKDPNALPDVSSDYCLDRNVEDIEATDDQEDVCQQNADKILKQIKEFEKEMKDAYEGNDESDSEAK